MTEADCDDSFIIGYDQTYRLLPDFAVNLAHSPALEKRFPVLGQEKSVPSLRIGGFGDIHRNDYSVIKGCQFVWPNIPPASSSSSGASGGRESARRLFRLRDCRPTHNRLMEDRRFPDKRRSQSSRRPDKRCVSLKIFFFPAHHARKAGIFGAASRVLCLLEPASHVSRSEEHTS